jgi:hypothetical protein
MKDQEKLDRGHLEWLVESRAANQEVSLKLLRLLQLHSKEITERKLITSATGLVATAFSLWRAAFFADKESGKLVAALAAAEIFLEGMLRDNAIAYPQDRKARDWTFNYYVDNARRQLEGMDPKRSFFPEMPAKWTTTERWDYYQLALARAVDRFAKALKKKV